MLFAYFEIFIFFLSEPGFTGLPDFQDFAYQRCFLMIEPYVYPLSRTGLTLTRTSDNSNAYPGNPIILQILVQTIDNDDTKHLSMRF